MSEPREARPPVNETYEQRRAREARQIQLGILASDPVWLAALEARLRHYREEQPQ